MGESYGEQRPEDVEAVFGPKFARALFEVAPGDGWSGPIASAYGWHLVWVEARSLTGSVCKPRARRRSRWAAAALAA